MHDPQTPVGAIGERALLRHLRSRIPAGTGVVLGVGDDTALVETGPRSLLTTDALVEGVHFVRDWTPPALLGRKALSVNLSDVGAMGGQPRYAMVSLCLPPETPFAFVDGLYDGLLLRAAEAGVSLVGGNLSSTSGPIVVDVALVGQVERPLLRSAARAGDLVAVAGRLGAAAEGLKLLRRGARLDEEGELVATGIWTESSSAAVRHCLRAQLDPVPPLSFARALAEQELVAAAIDISDGVSGDLLEICLESGLSALIDPSLLPVDPHAAGLERAQGGDPLALALHAGEDYQLLLALDPGRVAAVAELAGLWSLPLTVIGVFAAGEPRVLREGVPEPVPLEAQSHEHFRPRRASPSGAATEA